MERREAKTGSCADGFRPIRRPIAPPRVKKRVKNGPLRSICSRRFPSPTGAQFEMAAGRRGCVDGRIAVRGGSAWMFGSVAAPERQAQPRNPGALRSGNPGPIRPRSARTGDEQIEAASGGLDAKFFECRPATEDAGRHVLRAIQDASRTPKRRPPVLPMSRWCGQGFV